jgi:hypothetical protein
MRIVSLFLGLMASVALAGGALAEDAKPAAAGAAASPAGEQAGAAAPKAADASGASMDAKPADAAPAAPPAPAAHAAPAKPAHHAVVLGPVGTDEKGRTGRIHTVAPGDTLWDISEAYLGTPWVWPSIWKENPSVPNPHRIYPGNRIWISPTEMQRVTDAQADEMIARQPASPPAAVGDVVAQPLSSYTLSRIDGIGMVDPQLLEGLGTVLESPDSIATWLSAPQRVFISLGEGQVQPGDRFTVVRPGDDVRDPETHHLLGTFVARVGWIEVTTVHPETSEAVIRESTNEVGRGDRLIPRTEASSTFEVQPSAPAVEGQVAYTPNSRKETGGLDCVFLNRGTDSGLGVGTPLEVVRVYGDKKDPVSGQRKAMPDDVIANMLVISAESTTSVAVVTDSKKEVERGDHFRGLVR